jgi:hypothetical protein
MTHHLQCLSSLSLRSTLLFRIRLPHLCDLHANRVVQFFVELFAISKGEENFKMNKEWSEYDGCKIVNIGSLGKIMTEGRDRGVKKHG